MKKKTISLIVNHTTGDMWDVKSGNLKEHSDTLIHLLNYMLDNEYFEDDDDIEVVYKEDSEIHSKYIAVLDALGIEC